MSETDLDPIMQAAERLRRHHAGEPYRGVWPDDTLRMIDDQRVVGMFALSILPKGKRPVPMEFENHAFIPADGSLWCTYQRIVCRLTKSNWMWFRYDKVYATEADAKLALRWQKFDELIAASA